MRPWPLTPWTQKVVKFIPLAQGPPAQYGMKWKSVTFEISYSKAFIRLEYMKGWEQTVKCALCVLCPLQCPLRQISYWHLAHIQAKQNTWVEWFTSGVKREWPKSLTGVCVVPAMAVLHKQLFTTGIVLYRWNIPNEMFQIRLHFKNISLAKNMYEIVNSQL